MTLTTETLSSKDHLRNWSLKLLGPEIMGEKTTVFKVTVTLERGSLGKFFPKQKKETHRNLSHLVTFPQKRKKELVTSWQSKMKTKTQML